MPYKHINQLPIYFYTTFINIFSYGTIILLQTYNFSIYLRKTFLLFKINVFFKKYIGTLIVLCYTHTCSL